MMAKYGKLMSLMEKNEGLWLAEIELVDSSESFSKPEWILDEVSDDARYFSSNLSVNPFCDWE